MVVETVLPPLVEAVVSRMTVLAWAKVVVAEGSYYGSCGGVNFNYSMPPEFLQFGR